MPLAYLADRAVLRLSGRDVRDFLQGQVTNDIASLAPGRPLWAALLSPQGKTLFAFFLHDDGEAVCLDCDASVAEALARRLSLYRLRKDVAIEPTDLEVFAAWGEVPAGVPLDPRLPAAGGRWIAPAGAHAPDADLAQYHAHRLALGLPDQAEVADLLWLETNAAELQGVSFAKGCYVGQENTARMHYRDRVRRRLLPLKGAKGEAPVMSCGREAGTLRGVGAGGLRLAHLRMEQARGPLSVGGRPVELVWPAWLPRSDDRSVSP
ncbi:CAF17-like 4Fe-4S cluster assembly/insertion protein YgfZ [Thermaurantiacus sp.]